MKSYLLKLSAVLICSILTCAVSYALDVKDFTFKHLTHSDGLCSQRIYSIRQTSDGAVWWAAKNCVERYNGVSVKCYKLNVPEDVSFQAGRYLKLFLSSSGNLYAFDNKGEIFVYEPVKDDFSLLLDLRETLGPAIILNDIYVDNGIVWFATGNGVFRLEAGDVVPLKTGLVANAIADVDSKLFYCTSEGVLEDGTLKTICDGNVISGYYDARNSNLWLGCFAEGVKVVSFAKNGKMASVSSVTAEGAVIRNPVRSFCICNEEKMLLGIDGMGVYQAERKIDAVSGHLAKPLFDANNGRYGVLGGNGVYSVICDCWGNIIIGSYSGGIDIAHPVGMAAKIFRHQHNNLQSILNDHVNCAVQTPDGRLAMGTDNGVSIYDERNNRWTHSAHGSVVIGLSILSGGKIAAATYGSGVLEILPDGGSRQLYSVKNGILKDDYVYSIFEDRNNGIWMGCLDGPLVYLKGKTVKYFDINNVKDIIQFPDGRIAVGTVNGIFLIDTQSGSVSELDYSFSDSKDVSRYVCAMYLQGESTLWIGTDGGGVYVCDVFSPGGRHISSTDGLPSNTVSSICEDVFGRILISTDYGLAYVDPDCPDKVVNVNYGYDVAREYVGGSVASISDGRILYGTTTGALIINPDSLKELDYSATLNILGAKYDEDGKALVLEESLSLQTGGEISLGYDNRTFDIYFECINLSNQSDIAYRYRVDDGEWSQQSPIQYIRFINMAPGEYQLSIRCESSSCGTMLDEKIVSISIARPWWNSWWMWVVYALVIIVAFYGSYYFYRLHTQYMHLVVNNPKLFSLPVIRMEKKAKVEHEKTDDGKDFVQKATNLIVQYLSDSDFTIDSLCREMAMSRTLFYLKLKTYTGKSPHDFIRVIRLERAAALLRSGTPVAEAAAMTGFDNPKYFSTVFKKYFGVSPSKCR